MTSEHLKGNEHGQQNASTSFAAGAIAIDHPQQPGQKRGSVQYIGVSDLPNEKAAPLPNKTGQRGTRYARPGSPGIEVSAERREHVAREHHQIRRDRYTEK